MILCGSKAPARLPRILVSHRDDTNPARATILAEYHVRETAMCDQHSIQPQTRC
jgi:hypothetical protein